MPELAPLTVSDIRSAIAHREVVPYFQPIVELRSGRLCGFEILARWQHPTLGLVPPNRFIPLVENSDLMTPFWETLSEQAFALFSTNFPSHLTLSINVFPEQMNDRTLPARIVSLSKSSHFNPAQLTIEITESALLADLVAATDIAHDLKSHGMKVALDDFGTGYSSLRYLKSLPLDELKIDQSFVVSMNEQRESRKIAAAVAGLGQSLGLTTVAEGIEDRSHANMVFYLGCELGQGYLYSPPVPAAEALPMIDKNVLSAPAASPLLAAEMAANLEVAPALRLAQLQAIYEGTPDGLCFLDRKLRYVSVNRRFAEMFPSRDEPRLGKTVEEMSPTTFHNIELYLRRALYGEPSHNVEIMASRPGVSPSTAALVSFQPVRDEANEIVGVSVTVRDISSVKRLEQDLREYRDRYRMPLELSSNTYPYIVNPQGELVWEGRKGPRGYEIEELTGHKWHQLVHPDDLQSVLDSWKSDISAGVAHDHTYRMRVPDGTYHLVRSRATPRHDEHGQILGWYGLLEDIDDRDPHEP